jgi:hypothetical protein
MNRLEQGEELEHDNIWFGFFMWWAHGEKYFLTTGTRNYIIQYIMYKGAVQS